MKYWSTLLVALSVAAPVGAQQWQVAREQFAFAGRQLTIDVDLEAEGTLRVIRGSSGLVRVSGRSDMGMTGAGLTAYDRLTLTALSDGPVDYLVSVPDGVWVNVRLPGHVHSVPMSSLDRSRTFQWGPTMAQEATPPAEGALAPAPGGAGAGYTVFAVPVAPASVALPDLTRIRSVTVRVEGDGFRVGASRPLAMQKGDPQHLEIRPSGAPLELTVTVPAGTERFSLETAGGTALVIRGGEITVLCTPNTRQWLSDGRGWVTFSPMAGELRCGTRGDSRHRG